MKGGEQNRKANEKFIPHTSLLGHWGGQSHGGRRPRHWSVKETWWGDAMGCGTGSFALSICFSAANNHHLCITTCLLLPFCCKFPQYLLKQKWSYDHKFYFGHVGKACYRLHSEVGKESSHDLLHWLQHTDHNSQLAQTGRFIRPRRGYLPSPHFVFVIYRLCGHSSLKKNLR